MTVKEETFELSEGELVDGRYQTHSELGRGGMGRVYLAHQRPFDRQVVIKTMHPKFVSDEEHRQRFFNEALAASQLSHPNTVTVFDFGKTDRDVYFIAMEFIDGITLREAISRAGRLPIERAVPIIVQVAQSLGEAHRKGIIHRDLKPENIMLGRPGTPDEFVKVLDFGIAKLVDEKTSSSDDEQVFGTPGYMSPEQSRGEDVDQTSDLYSLSCCFYEMLSGKMPFSGETGEETIIKQQSEPVPPLPDSIARPIRDFIRTGLARDPAGRPGTADDYVADLLGSLRNSDGSTGLPAEAEPPTGEHVTGEHVTGEHVTGEHVTGEQARRSTPVPDDSTQDTFVQTATPIPTPAELRENATTSSNRSQHDSHAGERTSNSLGAVHSTPESSTPSSSGIHEFKATDHDELGSESRASEPAPADDRSTDSSVETQQATTDTMSSASRTRDWAIAATVISCLLAVAVVVLSLDDTDRAPAGAAAAAEAATLVFDSEPPGAVVSVDGREVGVTPTRYAAAPGAVVIVEMSSPGFKPERITHEVVEAPDDQRVFAALDRRELELSIVSPLSGARLTINDKPHGALSAGGEKKISLLWPDDELVIRMSHPDYQDYVARFPTATLEEQMRVAPGRSDFAPKIDDR